MCHKPRNKHNKSMLLVCETKFREKIDSPEPTLNIGGKIYTAHPRWITKEEAEQMKKDAKE